MSNNKAIVFGGAGFLGSHVADALTKNNYEVTIFDVNKSRHKSKNQNEIVGDILDVEHVSNACKGMNYVFNFAGIADLQEAIDRPIDAIKVNIIGTTNILEACRINKVDKFLFASTIYVYSNLGSFYKSTKQSCELLIENYNSAYDLNYSILRFGSLYGRRANEFNFINNALSQAILHGSIKRKGDGEEIRDYIHVEDAARASIEILSDDKFNNSLVTITGTQTIKMRDLMLMITEIFDNNITIKYQKERIPEHYLITPYSFRPRVSKKYVSNYYRDFGEGLLDTIYDLYENYSKDGVNTIFDLKDIKNNK